MTAWPLEAVPPPPKLWRVSNYHTLAGDGGLRASGRWHTRGRRIVYCASSPAASLLEMLVSLEIERGDIPLRYVLLKIAVPEATSCARLDPGGLPEDWRMRAQATRRMGDDWLSAAESALLEVPSALVPETWNVLINPAHAEAGAIRIERILRPDLDRRLW
jgi:RES domain-containing protein